MLDDVLDPTELYRRRDGAYVADLVIAAVAEFDVFTWLEDHGPVPARMLRAAMVDDVPVGRLLDVDWLARSTRVGTREPGARADLDCV